MLTAQDQVQLLSENGMMCFRSKDYLRALQCYTSALQVCKVHSLLEQKVVLLGNCSWLCLELGNYGDAFQYATDQLKMDPSCFKVYLSIIIVSRNLRWAECICPSTCGIEAYYSCPLGPNLTH